MKNSNDKSNELKTSLTDSVKEPQAVTDTLDKLSALGYKEHVVKISNYINTLKSDLIESELQRLSINCKPNKENVEIETLMDDLGDREMTCLIEDLRRAKGSMRFITDDITSYDYKNIANILQNILRSLSEYDDEEFYDLSNKRVAKYLLNNYTIKAKV